MPILRQETLPGDSVASSNAAGKDFSVKLALTDAQSAKIGPLLEQESRQVAQICANTNLSRAEKMSQFENIVRESDEQIKPALSTSQLHKLKDLRREQKQDVKRMIAEQKSGKPNKSGAS